MKIAILSRSISIHSTARLAEAALEQGHIPDVIDPVSCSLKLNAGNSEIYSQGEALKDYDAVIPRIGDTLTFHGTAILRQLELAGTYTLNSSDSIIQTRDKLRAHQILSAQKIAMPPTVFSHPDSRPEDLIDLVGGTLVIIKQLESTQGKGVFLAKNQKEAQKKINNLQDLNISFLVQEYIEEAQNSDVRCIVLGEQVIASMQRVAATGDFRSNLHSGGQARSVEITDQEGTLAIQAARALGITCGGVDLLRSENGPMILEVNSSPGLYGIEKVTGIDVAGQIVQYVSTLE